LQQGLQHRRILIVAEPGYGKSTLLRYLTLTYASRLRQEMRPLLPVLLRYRDIYSLLQSPSQPNTEAKIFPPLAAVIALWFQRLPELATLELSEAWFKMRLDQGHCLILLDGLDEVPKDLRREVSEWTDRQMRAHQNCQFIVTSRPHALEFDPDNRYTTS
jgi:predicted NACHT family NTPase